MDDTVLSRVEEHVKTQPTKVFWRQLGTRFYEITFRDFYGRCRSFAHFYRNAGVDTADVVLIFLPHGIHAVSAFFGCMYVGAVPSFMSSPSAKQHPSVYWPEHRDLFRRIGHPTILTNRAIARQMRANGLLDSCRTILIIDDVDITSRETQRTALSLDAAALLQHSSGTTSLKKGVILSHRTILKQIDTYARTLGILSDDNIVSWLPLYHDMGLIACTILPAVMGQTLTALDPFDWVAHPVTHLDSLVRHEGHFAWLPNFAFEHMVRAVPDGFAGDLSHVKAFIDCSEPCKAETFDRFQNRFAANGVRREQLQGCYAMAETVFAASQTTPGRMVSEVSIDVTRLQNDDIAVDASGNASAIRILSMGKPLPGVTIEIMRNEQVLPENHVGEIAIRCDFLFSGYHNEPEKTADRLKDGRYYSRDRGFLRDGELYVLGRLDDLMIINGRNLHAHEVEEIVSRVPGVKPGRAVAFGLFNAVVGSEELIVVAEQGEGRHDARSTDLSRAIRDAIYEKTNIEAKLCRLVEPGWLIKTTSGKLSRAANKQKHLQWDVDDTPKGASRSLNRPNEELFAFIASFFNVRPQDITRATTADAVQGWDSLAHATLMLEMERHFKISFTEQEIFNFRTVGELADRVAALRKRGEDGAQATERIVYQSSTASILRMGRDASPDVIIFAGLAKRFGGIANLDFGSVFGDTNLRDCRKFFVTDQGLDWYTSCFEEVATCLNDLSDRPKVLIGNSMGGYGALKFATALRDIVSVLAFVPQSQPVTKVRESASEEVRAKMWSASFVDGLYYCVLYGDLEDKEDVDYLRGKITDVTRQQVLVVPSYNHNMVISLNKRRLLGRIMDCALHPATMSKEVWNVVST